MTLHQPAAFYGINSMTLGSRVGKSGFEPLDNADLADKERLLAYTAWPKCAPLGSAPVRGSIEAPARLLRLLRALLAALGSLVLPGC